jgi:hypothetical protein
MSNKNGGKIVKGLEEHFTPVECIIDFPSEKTVYAAAFDGSVFSLSSCAEASIRDLNLGTSFICVQVCTESKITNDNIIGSVFQLSSTADIIHEIGVESTDSVFELSSTANIDSEDRVLTVGSKVLADIEITHQVTGIIT